MNFTDRKLVSQRNGAWCNDRWWLFGSWTLVARQRYSRESWEGGFKWKCSAICLCHWGHKVSFFFLPSFFLCSIQSSICVILPHILVFSFFMFNSIFAYDLVMFNVQNINIKYIDTFYIDYNFSPFSRCEVGIQELPKDSALGRLKGSDNVVSLFNFLTFSCWVF